MAIDEISVRKGHKYLTLVMDLESGAVLFVGEGKGAKSLEPFWVMLRRSRAKVRAVTTDMSTAYIGAVLENLPGVPLVFDHFHVVKLINKAFTEIRRGLHRESDVMGKKVFKGSRWILLKNPENISAERDEAAKLQEALKLSDAAQSTIDDCIKRASASGLGPLVRVATTLAGLKFGILNWYEHPISSGRKGVEQEKSRDMGKTRELSL